MMTNDILYRQLQRHQEETSSTSTKSDIINRIKDDNQPGQQLSTNGQTSYMTVSISKDDNKEARQI
jgi:hypothetical protein